MHSDEQVLQDTNSRLQPPIYAKPIRTPLTDPVPKKRLLEENPYASPQLDQMDASTHSLDRLDASTHSLAMQPPLAVETFPEANVISIEPIVAR
jgi:hypothetical protein